MDETPRELRIEVKTSRSGSFQIGERDIDGIGPGGHVAALLTDRLLHGPRWVLVPARTLQSRGYGEKELADGAEDRDLVVEINRGWSDWVLDRDAWEKLLEPGILDVAARITWCRRQHPPRAHQSRGNVRETKLHSALAALRARIDDVAAGDTGAQLEGQFHQSLLGDVLEQAGFDVTLNPVGVPDIVATRTSAAATTDIRERLSGWEPPSPAIRVARDAVLDLEPEELAQFLSRIRGE
jgi:hypothetical protein